MVSAPGLPRTSAELQRQPSHRRWSIQPGGAGRARTAAATPSLARDARAAGHAAALASRLGPAPLDLPAPAWPACRGGGGPRAGAAAGQREPDLGVSPHPLRAVPRSARAGSSTTTASRKPPPRHGRPPARSPAGSPGRRGWSPRRLAHPPTPHPPPPPADRPRPAGRPLASRADAKEPRGPRGSRQEPARGPPRGLGHPRPARPARRSDHAALPGTGRGGGADRDALGRVGRAALGRCAPGQAAGRRCGLRTWPAARAAGVPSARAASGSNLSLPWLPRRVVRSSDATESNTAGKRRQRWQLTGAGRRSFMAVHAAARYQVPRWPRRKPSTRPMTSREASLSSATSKAWWPSGW
jgi:hypothetical protein